MHVCSRMQRMAGELAGRTMRAGAVGATVITAILDGYRSRHVSSGNGRLPYCPKVRRGRGCEMSAVASSATPTSTRASFQPACLIWSPREDRRCLDPGCRRHPVLHVHPNIGRPLQPALVPTNTRPTTSRKDWVWVSTRVHLPRVLGGVPGLPRRVLTRVASSPMCRSNTWSQPCRRSTGRRSVWTGLNAAVYRQLTVPRSP